MKDEMEVAKSDQIPSITCRQSLGNVSKGQEKDERARD